MELKNKYCESLTNYNRLINKKIYIGDLTMGAGSPIRLQSMTNTNTNDLDATVKQCIRIFEAGGEMVRITAPAPRDAENLKYIKEKIIENGYNFPLVADIHFNPKAAEIAAEIVEKVRINPGNYSENKKSNQIEYTKQEYEQGIAKIRENFLPLLQICKQNNTAIRIGTNHGSLSERIISRYGDTPLGMAEATLEFLRICKEVDFNNVVISLKASNTLVMVQACRILVQKMHSENLNYPMHLGVTEAGDGEDGRIKSAVGIGSLLSDGVGDTIRVSLTEDPELEIPVAKKIVDITNDFYFAEKLPEIPCFYNPFEYNKRESIAVQNIGGDNVPVVFGNNCSENADYSIMPDYYFSGNSVINKKNGDSYPYFTANNFFNTNIKSEKLNFVEIDIFTNNEILVNLSKEKTVVLVASPQHKFKTGYFRYLFYKLQQAKNHQPVILRISDNEPDFEKFQLKMAIEAGSVFIDGFGEGIWLENTFLTNTDKLSGTAFAILQACRARVSKTEYISCPSCGRTLFDLQKATARIKQATLHLTGLKIGIMGCIVNGPGEMADAHYGYVGAGAGKINLYKGKQVIKKNIPENKAVDELIELIKSYGDWKEKNIT